STHGVDRLEDHPNLDFGAQHARYGFGVQPKSDRLLADQRRDPMPLLRVSSDVCTHASLLFSRLEP
ncbi:MAG: hypothetical protein ACRD8U_19315, partial [Pyrinomonadaceae bacterium]